MELPFNVIDLLTKLNNEGGILVAFAAFHPFVLILIMPLFWILKKLNLYTPKEEMGYLGFGLTCIIAIGWILGFVSQILLFFIGIPGIKLFLIYIAMYLCLSAFVFFNVRSLKKQFQLFQLSKK